MQVLSTFYGAPAPRSPLSALDANRLVVGGPPARRTPARTLITPPPARRSAAVQAGPGGVHRRSPALPEDTRAAASMPSAMEGGRGASSAQPAEGPQVGVCDEAGPGGGSGCGGAADGGGGGAGEGHGGAEAHCEPAPGAAGGEARSGLEAGHPSGAVCAERSGPRAARGPLAQGSAAGAAGAAPRAAGAEAPRSQRPLPWPLSVQSARAGGAASVLGGAPQASDSGASAGGVGLEGGGCRDLTQGHPDSLRAWQHGGLLTAQLTAIAAAAAAAATAAVHGRHHQCSKDGQPRSLTPHTGSPVRDRSGAGAALCARQAGYNPAAYTSLPSAAFKNGSLDGSAAAGAACTVSAAPPQEGGPAVAGVEHCLRDPEKPAAPAVGGQGGATPAAEQGPYPNPTLPLGWFPVVCIPPPPSIWSFEPGQAPEAQGPQPGFPDLPPSFPHLQPPAIATVGVGQGMGEQPQRAASRGGAGDGAPTQGRSSPAAASVQAQNGARPLVAFGSRAPPLPPRRPLSAGALPADPKT